jgi:hypothetical protein
MRARLSVCHARPPESIRQIRPSLTPHSPAAQLRCRTSDHRLERPGGSCALCCLLACISKAASYTSPSPHPCGSIESVQPCQPAGLGRLALLERFSNNDKHRLIHAAVTSLTDQPQITVQWAIPTTVISVDYRPGKPIRDGDKLARFKPNVYTGIRIRPEGLVEITDAEMRAMPGSSAQPSLASRVTKTRGWVTSERRSKTSGSWSVSSDPNGYQRPVLPFCTGRVLSSYALRGWPRQGSASLRSPAEPSSHVWLRAFPASSLALGASRGRLRVRLCRSQRTHQVHGHTERFRLLDHVLRTTAAQRVIEASASTHPPRVAASSG